MNRPMRLCRGLLFLGFAFAGPLAAGAPKYPQLIATRYTDAKLLPAGFKKPEARRYDFVDTAKLPRGAKIVSAAKAANGVVWVVTDQGAFRSDKDGYASLAQGPRQLLPA